MVKSILHEPFGVFPFFFLYIFTDRPERTKTLFCYFFIPSRLFILILNFTMVGPHPAPTQKTSYYRSVLGLLIHIAEATGAVLHLKVEDEDGALSGSEVLKAVKWH